MKKSHHYQIQTIWTGNQGTGTSSYRTYSRDHEISAPEKIIKIPASSDPAFRGDKSRYNPEELFLSSLSACHMLWYLHLCSVNDVVVLSYADHAMGIMEESKNGSGKFTSVTLRPHIRIMDESKIEVAQSLHHQANEMCFIANSCNFPIAHEAIIRVLKKEEI